jgi:PAS domain S-box-containing protein
MAPILPLFKAVRTAYKLSAASISTNAAAGHHPQIQSIQEFRIHFWKAFAARSSKRECSAQDGEPMPSLTSSKAVEHASLRQEEDRARVRAHARQELFKHFRMSAAFRAMKRGDGATSKFSLGERAKSVPNCTEAQNVHGELTNPIDTDSANKAREEMRRHFWSSHQRRKEARNAIRACPVLHDPEHSRQDCFELPTTLSEYLEAETGARDCHQPRAMAITKIETPFKIVDVNSDWSRLCGYTREEAVGSTFQRLLQGPETNMTVAKELTASLLRQSTKKAKYKAVLTNYRSDGTTFQNYLQVGHIKNEIGNITHFVGLFTELSRKNLQE